VNDVYGVRHCLGKLTLSGKFNKPEILGKVFLHGKRRRWKSISTPKQGYSTSEGCHSQ
jgi:hypothetical protein